MKKRIRYIFGVPALICYDNGIPRCTDSTLERLRNNMGCPCCAPSQDMEMYRKLCKNTLSCICLARTPRAYVKREESSLADIELGDWFSGQTVENLLTQFKIDEVD